MRRELTGLYLSRIHEFMGRLKDERVYAAHAPLTATCGVTDAAVPFTRRQSAAKARPIGVGEQWGSAWQNAWFHLTGKVPADWAGHDVALHFNANGESLVFSKDGCPLYGLTNQSVFANDFGKDIYRMFEPCRGGEKVDLWIEATASSLFGVNRKGSAERLAPERHGDYVGKVVSMELVLFDTELWHYWLDLRILLDLYEGLPHHAPRRTQILEAMSRSIDVFAENRNQAAAARAELRPLWDVPVNPADLAVTAVGHAHIDTGWLWRVQESIRKTARTFASQIALIERYPGYVFGASQPQHYAFVKEHYPELYAKVKRAIKAGQWECQGGMWVEADCNLTSGESLVRQFMHGKNFFMDEFGVDVTNLWIPDVFGYSASMPQIMRKAGVDFFLTQKISWSRHNEFPHNTFQWRGIDGSEVITHFPPENTYNSNLTPKALIEAQTRFKENGHITAFASLFGIGDGGGGPREEHVEHGLRLAALNGSPRVSFGTADSYFNQLRDQAGTLERWVGELYLEVHRGTLTTQAATKRGNRKLELKLRETEMFLSLLPAALYPRATLDKVWKILLVNQFHDILPGSSIHAVYEDTSRQHAECLATCDTLIAQAADRVLRTEAGALTLLNSLGCTYTAPVTLPAAWAGHSVLDAAGQTLPAQREGDHTTVRVNLPPYSLTTLRRGPKARKVEPVADLGLVLENDLIRYEFAPNAVVTRIFDKQTRAELLPAGERANLLALYEDRPHNWDAWDIDVWYENQLIEHARPVAHTTCCNGPVRRGLRFELAIGESSTLTQTVALAHDSRRLDFETQADWREFHRMLRVSFATRIQATEATCDIQYGYLRRPTHRNTSWDMSKFEVAAHRYVDLSDLDEGVALLNDCKYGHKLQDRTIDLNLLRSPSEPDPDADYGRHVFTYALLPHAGTLVESDVIPQAAMLNQPPAVIDGRAAAGVQLPCTLEATGISMEVLKQAEKANHLIVRLVETLGRRSSGTLTLADGGKLVETNLMEWTDGAVIDATMPVALTLKPFEIRTYKILATSRPPSRRAGRSAVAGKAR